MKLVKKLSDFLSKPAWKLIYDKDFNKHLKSETRPYKVFTALVTQNGSDTTEVEISGGDNITEGVTYRIVSMTPGDDLTKYGAPNNNVDTQFICTKSANHWGADTSSITYVPAVPVATVLENTLGNVWFTYNTTGQYVLTSNNLFTSKTTASFNLSNDDANTLILAPIYHASPSVVFIQSGYVNLESQTFVLSDDMLYLPSLIEIKVYN